MLLDGLATRGRTLADARQADLGAWLASDQGSHRREAGNFARWAKRHRLTIDTETRWAQARWLLHDHTLNHVDRVAGLLVLLCPRTPPPSAASPSSMCRAPTTQ